MLAAPENWNRYYGNQRTSLEVNIGIRVSKESSVRQQYLFYGNDDIDGNGVVLEHKLFDDYSIGNACAAMLSFTVKGRSEEARLIRKGQILVFRVRLRHRQTSIYAYSYSGYAPQGRYIVDSVTSYEDGSFKVIAYDYLMLLDGIDVSGTNWMGSNAPVYAEYLKDKYDNATLTSFLLVGPGGGASSSFPYDDRIMYALMPQSLSTVAARDVFKSLAAFGGSNLTANKNAKGVLISPSNESSFTQQPLGTVVTAASLETKENMGTIAGVMLNSGSTSLFSSEGYLVRGNVLPDFYANVQDTVDAYENMLSGNDNVRKFDNVVVSGATVTPLVELGDVVSVEVGDGYFNFTLCGYRLTYCSGEGGYCCYGELSANRSEESAGLFHVDSEREFFEAEVHLTSGGSSMKFFSKKSVEFYNALAMSYHDMTQGVAKPTFNYIEARFTYGEPSDQLEFRARLFVIDDYYQINHTSNDDTTQAHVERMTFSCEVIQGQIPDDYDSISLYSVLNVDGDDSQGMVIECYDPTGSDSGGSPGGSVIFDQKCGVGNVKTDSTSSVGVATSSNVNVCSLSLPPGIWMVCARVSFPVNATGRRAAKLSTTSGDTRNVLSTVTLPAISGANTHVATARCFMLNSGGTVYLVGYQTSGETLTCSGSMEATKIG